MCRHYAALFKLLPDLFTVFIFYLFPKRVTHRSIASGFFTYFVTSPFRADRAFSMSVSLSNRDAFVKNRFPFRLGIPRTDVTAYRLTGMNFPYPGATVIFPSSITTVPRTSV